MNHLVHRFMKSSHGIGHKLGSAANMIGHKLGPAIIGNLNNAVTVANTASKLKNLLTRGMVKGRNNKAYKHKAVSRNTGVPWAKQTLTSGI